MESRWEDVLSVHEVEAGTPRLVKVESNRITIVRTADGTLHAVDDRCPHEGYPLCQGTVAGAVLTCPFHNFKFDLETGACLMGDERVRVFPLRVVGDTVQVDVAPVDPAQELPRRWASLRAGLAEDRIGQMAREVVRLLHLGVPARRLSQHAAAWDGAHGQWGSSHALAVAADVLGVLPDGLDAARRLMLAYELASRQTARRPAHPPATPIPPGPSTTFPERWSAVVEAEDADRALGMLAGALAEGWGRAELQPAFLRIASDHFLEYGHCLIYATKVWDLLQGAPPLERADTLAGLVRMVVYGTREDTLPAWTGWRRQTDRTVEHWPRWSANAGPVPNPEAVASAVLDGGKQAALQAVVGALDAGASPEAVARVLSEAAVERFLRFDWAHDLDPDVQDNWLSVTHVQTFHHAIRVALRQWSGPQRIGLLFQGARMLAMTQPLDVVPAQSWTAAEASPNDVLDAVRQGLVDVAVSRALGCVDAAGLKRALLGLLDEEPVVRPIFAAHVLKQTLVAFDDAQTLDSARPIAALVRFLAAPRQERRTGRLVGEAIRLVRDGATPRVLAR